MGSNRAIGKVHLFAQIHHKRVGFLRLLTMPFESPLNESRHNFRRPIVHTGNGGLNSHIVEWQPPLRSPQDDLKVLVIELSIVIHHAHETDVQGAIFHTGQPYRLQLVNRAQTKGEARGARVVIGVHRRVHALDDFPVKTDY